MELAVGRQLLAIGLEADVERVLLPCHGQDQLLGRRLVDALDQRILDQSEDRHLVVGRQTPVAAGAREVDAHAVLVDERLHVAAERGHQAEVVQDHRPQLEDECAKLLQRLVDHLPERRELSS